MITSIKITKKLPEAMQNYYQTRIIIGRNLVIAVKNKDMTLFESTILFIALQGEILFKPQT